MSSSSVRLSCCDGRRSLCLPQPPTHVDARVCAQKRAPLRAARRRLPHVQCPQLSAHLRTQSDISPPRQYLFAIWQGPVSIGRWKRHIAAAKRLGGGAGGGGGNGGEVRFVLMLCFVRASPQPVGCLPRWWGACASNHRLHRENVSLISPHAWNRMHTGCRGARKGGAHGRGGRRACAPEQRQQWRR